MLLQSHAGAVNLLHHVVTQPINKDPHLSGTCKRALQCAPLQAPSLENAQCPLFNVHCVKKFLITSPKQHPSSLEIQHCRTGTSDLTNEHSFPPCLNSSSKNIIFIYNYKHL